MDRTMNETLLLSFARAKMAWKINSLSFSLSLSPLLRERRKIRFLWVLRMNNSCKSNIGFVLRADRFYRSFHLVLMSPDPPGATCTEQKGQLFVVAVSTTNAIHRDDPPTGIVSRFPCRGVCLIAGINFRQHARVTRSHRDWVSC